MGRTRGNIDVLLYPFERWQRETNSSGKGALYHCNYCNKDTTDTVRIKCNTCPDFDLCVECFSVGAEVWPHKSDHPYRVIENLSFSIISPDWSAEQEMLLLEGIEMFGPSNWAEVAEHVGSKSEKECAEHYTTYYLSAPNFIPEMKNPEDLSAMAKGKGKKLTGKGSEPSNDRDSAGSRRVKENGCEKGFDSSPMSLNGYNPKRHEFDIEYDNDAEKMLVDVEFNEDDTEIERELKLRLVRAYSRRVDERNRRKDFIIERGLLYPNPIEKDFTPEERDLCRRFDPFMRFHSKEEHNEFLKSHIEKNRILQRIRDLEEAQAAGFRTVGEVNDYIENKKRRIAEEKKQSKNTEQEAGGSSGIGRSSSMSGLNMHDQPPAPSQKLSAVDLLSEAEKQLCRETGFSAKQYMHVQQIMASIIFNGRITKKSDTYAIFVRVEPSKLDRVYDMLVKKGIAPPP